MRVGIPSGGVKAKRSRRNECLQDRINDGGTAVKEASNIGQQMV
jgi:hypothetical protein